VPELIAQGKNMDHRWRRLIPPGETILLGRATPAFRVPWDDRISREHIQLRLINQKLYVEKLPQASNPIFHQGREANQFVIDPGEHFVIGSTSFTLSQEAAHASLDVPHPIHQKTYSTEYLRNLRFRNAEKRIEVLNQLPDVISSAGNEKDLINRISNLLLAGIPAASTIGFVLCPSEAVGDRTRRQTLVDTPEAERTIDKKSGVEILHWDRRAGETGDFRPSERLIRQAISHSQTVLHQWKIADSRRSAPTDFTFDLENDWAFVCPLDGPAAEGWGIYVAGQQTAIGCVSPDSDADDLQGDIKFCQLIGAVLSNLFQVKQLERRQASFRSFFSPVVLDALVGRDPEDVLAPQECQVAVMFCDLRGFSQKSEDLRANLFQLLRHVSRSLDVMTGEILRSGGVIGDFHGDAAMGFWGWPLQQFDTAKRAVETAVAIEERFRQMKFEELGFQIAIGIASGPAVVGKIGSQDQVKVTAFGPVVNRASRIEGMNRLLNTTILIDQATCDQVLPKGEVMTLEDGQTLRSRSMGRFLPFGIGAVVEVHQLWTEPQGLSGKEVRQFDEALNSFQSGRWDECLTQVRALPANDPGRIFLENFMANYVGRPPEDWNGIVKLGAK
jgi:adenylate cyclase